MSREDVAEMIANIVKAIRARRKKAQAKAGGGAGSTWEAMILQEAGPGRQDVLRPETVVHLGRRD